MTDDLPRNKFNWKTVIGITLAVLGITIIYGLAVSYFFDGQWEHSGPFGDTFGLLTALFSGASLIGVIATVYLQTKELEEQRKEIKASRVAQQTQAEHQLKAAKINAIQTQISLFSEGLDANNTSNISRSLYQNNTDTVLCSLLEKLEELMGEPREITRYLHATENTEYVIHHPVQNNLDIKIKIDHLLDDNSTRLSITSPVGCLILGVKENDKVEWLAKDSEAILSSAKKTTISLPTNTIVFKVSTTKERLSRVIRYSMGEYTRAP